MSQLHCLTPGRGMGRGDVVLVHGLGGHWRDTWAVRRNGGEGFWPHDLGQELPDVRVYCLEYDATPSRWFGHSMPLVDRASNTLDLLRSEGLGAAPLVFICHSLGGLLVKNVLRASKDAAESDNSLLWLSTCGVIFFATPHTGSRLATLGGLVLSLLGPAAAFFRPAPLVRELRSDESRLRELNKWYAEHATNRRIDSRIYFETAPYLGFLKVVDADTACPPIKGVDPVPLDGNHFAICKFPPQHYTFRSVKSFVARCIEASAWNSCSPARQQLATNGCVTDMPPEPDGHFPRSTHLSRLESAIGNPSYRGVRLRVVTGPAGSGKSTLVAAVCRRLAGRFPPDSVRWVDCRTTFDVPSLDGATVVVFDNLPDRHPVLTGGHFGRASHAWILVTTSCEDVARQARSATSALADPSTLESLQPFSDDETRQYFSQALPQDLVATAVKQGIAFGGRPVALQVLRELYIRKRDGAGQVVYEDLASLLGEWLATVDTSGTLERVVECLAVVPFCGMDRPALSHVIGREDDDVDGAVRRLTRIGLVTTVCSGDSASASDVVMLHQSIRDCFSPDTVPHTREWRARYLGVLERRLQAGGAVGTLTCVDAWLTGWTAVFEGADASGTLDRFKRQEELLETLLNCRQTRWTKVVQRNPEFLSSRFRDPGKESCATVIGVAHAISRLPADGLLAATIWPGCRNDDVWARAACIAAAVEQWHELGSRQRTAGLKELRHWLEYAFEMFGRQDPSWTGVLDLDYLAATTGLMRIGTLNDSIEALTSHTFGRRFHCVTLSHLAVILRLSDEGVLTSGPAPRREAFVEKVTSWVSAANSPAARVRATAALAGRYLKQARGLELAPLLELPVDRDEPSLGLDVANLCRSDGFGHFVKRWEKDPSRYII